MSQKRHTSSKLSPHAFPISPAAPVEVGTVDDAAESKPRNRKSRPRSHRWIPHARRHETQQSTSANRRLSVLQGKRAKSIRSPQMRKGGISTNLTTDSKKVLFKPSSATVEKRVVVTSGLRDGPVCYRLLLLLRQLLPLPLPSQLKITGKALPTPAKPTCDPAPSRNIRAKVLVALAPPDAQPHKEWGGETGISPALFFLRSNG